MRFVIANAGSNSGSLVGFLGICVFTAIILFALTSFSWHRVRKTLPGAEEIKQAILYRSWIDARSGFIESDRGRITWRFDPVVLLEKGDALFYDADDREVLRIHRPSRFRARFHIIEDERAIGVIHMRSVLRNKYTLELEDGTTWTFRMPLFTVYFRGSSTTDGRVWIQMGPRSKRQWNILVKPGFDSIQILSAIAFIHHRWYL